MICAISHDTGCSGPPIYDEFYELCCESLLSMFSFVLVATMELKQCNLYLRLPW